MDTHKKYRCKENSLVGENKDASKIHSIYAIIIITGLHGSKVLDFGKMGQVCQSS